MNILAVNFENMNFVRALGGNKILVPLLMVSGFLERSSHRNNASHSINTFIMLF